MTTKNSSLAIVAAYPPPYGGVSVGVQRLCHLLDRHGVQYVVYNAVSRSGDGKRIISVCRRRWLWTLKYMLVGREPAIYLMSDRLITWLLAALSVVLRGKRVMVRLRNAKLSDWVAESLWLRMLAGLALRRMTGVICVSSHLADVAADLGVDRRRIHWCPSFMPPSLSPEGKEHVVHDALRFAESRSPLIAANGRVSWYRGVDLYGLDQLVELAALLKPDYPNLGIIVCFWEHDRADEAYLTQLRQLATKKAVGENIYFNTESGPFVPVLALADLFVRPTNTDGDASSVREALYLGIPAVVSDVVERPSGTLLFKTRDLDEFESRVRAALALGRRGPMREPKLSEEDRHRIETYVDLLANLADGRDTMNAGAAASGGVH